MKILCTIISMLVSFSALAQTKQSYPVPDSDYPLTQDFVVNSLLRNNQHSISTQRTTGTQQRVIKETYYTIGNFPPKLRDSVHHYYPSNTGGSFYDYNDINFNNAVLDFFDYASFSVYFPSQQNLNDSILYWHADSSGVRKASKRRTFTFGADKKVAESVLDYFPPNGYTHTSNTYDNQGKLIAQTKTDRNGDENYHRYFYYNTSNQLTNDTIFIKYPTLGWKVYACYNYTYDINGNVLNINNVGFDLNSNSWYLSQKTTATYYPSNQVKTVSIEWDTLSPGPLSQLYYDSFGYSNSSFYTYWKRNEYSGGVLQSEFLVEKTLNPINGLPDSVFRYDTYTQWQQVLWKLNYNSFNNPTGLSSYILTGNSYNLVDSVSYVYEEFENGIITPLVQNDYSLYPNPTRQTLNISWNGFKQGMSVTVNIINAAGQLVRKEELKWMQQTEAFNIASLQPGMYWINISDASGKVFSQSFLKQ